MAHFIPLFMRNETSSKTQLLMNKKVLHLSLLFWLFDIRIVCFSHSLTWSETMTMKHLMPVLKHKFVR